MKRILNIRKFTTLKSYSYSFSGAGWLTPFHLGVINSLKELKLLNKDSIVSGSSGGAIAAIVCSTNLNEIEVLEAFKISIKDMKPMNNIDNNLRFMLEKMLPLNAYIDCTNHSFITITPIKPPHKTKIISTFQSNKDLIDCVATSCFIPGYSAKKLSTIFRDEECIDGGILSFLPSVGEITITPLPQICKYTINPRRPIIHPLIVPDFKVSLRLMLRWTLFPASPEILDELFQVGYKAGKIWGTKQIEANQLHENNR